MGASIVNQSNDIIPVVIKAGIDSTVKLDNRELVFCCRDKKGGASIEAPPHDIEYSPFTWTAPAAWPGRCPWGGWD